MIVYKSNTGGGVGLLGGKSVSQWENYFKFRTQPLRYMYHKFFCVGMYYIYSRAQKKEGGGQSKNKPKIVELCVFA